MKKTGGEVESDVFAILKASTLNTTIKGSIYKEGMRPVGANTEDAVVSFVAGLDGQIQTGVVIVNIYVPKIDNGSKVRVKDIPRCNALEKAGNTFVQSLKPSCYKFSLGQMIKSFPVEGIEQHFVNIKLKFELKTF